MSNLINIEDLRKQFEDKLTSEEWKKFSEVQYQMIDAYQKQIDLLRRKNEQLEKLLMSKMDNVAMPLTAEEIICIEQIDRIRHKSIKQELTLEEVKRLDLLVKNLKLIREESTVVINSKSSHEAIPEEDLVAIAQSGSETTDSQ